MTGARGALLLASLLACASCSDMNDLPPEKAECGQGQACECEPGDSDCTRCKAGYRAALVGNRCVPTCDAPEIDCGEHGACEESAQGARCVCDPGHSGADCSGCASGLSPNAAGQCVAELSAPALLTLSGVSEQVVLGSLVPPAWDFRPLAPVASTLTDVAYDSASELAYALDGGRLISVNLATGETAELTDAELDLGRALCLDSAGRRAFTASADALYAVDLDAGDVTTLAPFGAAALEYDAERGVVLGVDAAGATFELAGTEPLVVGRAPLLESLAMAFDAASERAYFLGTEAESERARLLRYCESTLTRFGAVPAWHVRIAAALDPGAEQPYELDYQGVDPALVAVDLSGTSVDTVSVSTPHPDAAVCIVAEGSSSVELAVELTAATRASLILVVAPARSVLLDSSARSTESSANVVVNTGHGLTISGPSAGVTEYDDQAWSDLGLTTFANFPERPTSRLVLMNWPSQATLRLDLAHRAAGSALAWVGEAP